MGLVIFGAIARLVPHPANFAPLGAIAIFGGLFLPRKLAILVPLSAMLVSDIVIGFYSWSIMLVVYLSFALTAFASTKIKHSFKAILGTTLAGSILFYLTTNAAVWAFGTMYAHDFAGLMQSYTMAIPFFRNSLLSDLFYTSVMVTSYILITNFHTNYHIQSLHRNQS
ncbi:MAG: hypothetical protein A2821_00270 [Candidatus Magasanikbacteria bacterium RIFCSPHIGHO2_01_FULL_41_23]|uniref:ECF transporter S component n=1 Tax=Candidatus Magasanikbacteria bacterium RIFCSPLOWO2_01_FULL_40_15 TaxID=1798686 RepID=A0A1F6N3V6_9BACT|nr:MAG: hypothetical protein A2821_00270 [Candidatus Magasanikbacteria bacterium RIFCSPHIGHO2_01_FULL_41_23]OGH76619.1 MAG: hypothetical protein A3F22_04500 [Candidatus Magasanikbacteria bacterium RIFCSPHIGHO2_12_FULL_41_16]OGH78597.1 MAG: hypothetical protein A2983_02700 [Candidatus Magasanikbacteria bacterium RIFCSPLOWO2_01_FULL_40_15]